MQLMQLSRSHLSLLTGAVALIHAAHAPGMPPSNDDCLSATVLSTNDFQATLNLSQATIQECEAESLCESVFGSHLGEHSVWFKLTPPEDGLLSVSAQIQGSFETPLVAVFDGCSMPFFGGCLAPQALDCSLGISYFGITTASIFELPVSGDVPLLVKIAMFSGSGTAVDVDIEFHPAAPNDLCSDATPITTASFQDTLDLEGAALDFDGFEGSELGCFLLVQVEALQGLSSGLGVRARKCLAIRRPKSALT